MQTRSSLDRDCLREVLGRRWVWTCAAPGGRRGQEARGGTPPGEIEDQAGPRWHVHIGQCIHRQRRGETTTVRCPVKMASQLDDAAPRPDRARPGIARWRRATGRPTLGAASPPPPAIAGAGAGAGTTVLTVLVTIVGKAQFRWGLVHRRFPPHTTRVCAGSLLIRCSVPPPARLGHSARAYLQQTSRSRVAPPAPRARAGHSSPGPWIGGGAAGGG